MDVAVKGMFWLLKTCLASPTFAQFILIGGDAGCWGILLIPAHCPVTEEHPLDMAYPGLLCALEGSRRGACWNSITFSTT